MSEPLAWAQAADAWLLLKLNREWTSPALDAVLPALTDLHKRPWFLYGAAPAALGWWLYKGRRAALKVLVVAALAVGAADLAAYRVFKPLFDRPRPARTVGGVIERAPSSSRAGFPSNHAANAGAAAAVLATAYPAWAPLHAALALLMAYTRVYCGAHYPGDVAAGLLLGLLIGLPWARLMLGGGAAAGKKRSKR